MNKFICLWMKSETIYYYKRSRGESPKSAILLPT